MLGALSIKQLFRPAATVCARRGFRATPAAAVKVGDVIPSIQLDNGKRQGSACI